MRSVPRRRLVLAVLTFVLSLLLALVVSIATIRLPAVLDTYQPYSWLLVLVVAVVSGYVTILTFKSDSSGWHSRGVAPFYEAKIRTDAIKAISDGVRNQLEQDLDHRLRIRLRFAERLGAVDVPREFIVRDEMPGPTPNDILAVFDSHNNNLLILGAPGAGKSTLLLELALKLLNRAETRQDDPIPILLSIANWDGAELQPWIVREASSRYVLAEKVIRDWWNNGKLMLLLDGLDEFATKEERERCIKELNELYESQGLRPMAVCCRTEDYLSLDPDKRLKLRGAVEIKRLSAKQLDKFLNRTDERLAGLRDVVRSDPVLAELLSTPLMLTIAVATFQGLSAERVSEAIAGNSELTERRQHLFDAYVPAMLATRPGKFRDWQTIRWLAVLARQASRSVEVPSAWRWLHFKLPLRVLGPIGMGLLPAILGSIATVGILVPFAARYGLFVALLGGLLVTAINVTLSTIFSAADSPWSFKGILATGFLILFGAVVGWAPGLALQMSFNSVTELIPRIPWSLGIIVPGTAVVLITASKLVSVSRESSDYAELLLAILVVIIGGCLTILLPILFNIFFEPQILIESQIVLYAALGFGLTSGAIAGFFELLWVGGRRGVRVRRGTPLIAAMTPILVGVMWSATTTVAVFPTASLTVAEGALVFVVFVAALTILAIGLVAGRRFGGFVGDAAHSTGACLAGLASWPMFVAARLQPWRRRRFLDYAADQVLLKRVDGRYEFYHLLIRDYFARIEL